MKHNRISGFALIIGCALPVLMLLGVLFRGELTVSQNENRTLARFPALTLSSFLSGAFQDGLESALGDQYPFGEDIKDRVLTAQNTVYQAEAALLLSVAPPSGAEYREITPGYYHYGNDDHRIVEKPWQADACAGQMLENAQLFNSAENVKKYVYFIRNSRAQDFSLSDGENNGLFDAVRFCYAADGYGCFSVPDYEAFCQNFYQTDHHWNHRGADEGYRQIVALLLGEQEETLPVEKEWTFNVVFNGSYARQTKTLCAEELFSVYSYPSAKIKTTLSGKKGQYGHAALYEKDRFPTDELRNHYAYYYGGDYGEILLDNGSSHGRNLLVIADSYSNPINLLLASHFDQTCIIDLRYYQQDMGKPFDVNAYIREHNIDTLLMMGDIVLFGGALEQEAER